jgi:tetratricopeptide (TPR) repeat protein
MIPRPILKAKVENGPGDRPSKNVRFEMEDFHPSATSVKLITQKKTILTSYEKKYLFENPATRAPMVNAKNQNDQMSPNTSFKSSIDVDQKENLEVDANLRMQRDLKEQDDMRFRHPGSKRAAFLAALSTVFKAVFKPKPCTNAGEYENKTIPASEKIVDSIQPEISVDKPKVPATQADDEEEGGSHASQGNTYFRQGDFLAALRSYNAAIANREDSHLVRSNRSACLHQLGRHHEALRDARIAVLQAPGLPTGRCRKAAAHVALGDFSAARREYSAALFAAPNDPLVLRAIAEVDELLASERALRRAGREAAASLPAAAPLPAAAGAADEREAADATELAREDLDLRGQALGDEGVRRLSESLATNQSVRRLWLDSNGVADAGATALAAALRRNRTLVVLGLSGNDVGDAGATALAAALPANQGLQEVLLEGNRVGLAGGEALARALEGNPRIRRLALGQNRILADDAGGSGDCAGAGPGRVSLRECADIPAPWLRTCAPGGGGGGGDNDCDIGCSAGCGTRLLAAAGGSCDPLWRPSRGCHG